MRHRIKIWIVILLLVLLAGCSTRTLMINSVTEVMETGIIAFEQDDDFEMLEKAFPANIKLLETFLANDPGNEKLLVLLSRMYASYAFAFLEEKIEAAASTVNRSADGTGEYAVLKQTATRYYQKGTDYALRALEVRHPGARENLHRVSTAGPFVQSLGTRDVPALFWYGFNLGAYVDLSRDSVKVIARAYLVEMAMKRVLALDPTYFHGSAHLVLLAFYAARSPMMGGNLNLALAHYQKLKALNGNQFFLSDLYYARYYLYQKQDRRQFVQVLTGIVNASVDDKTYLMFNQVAVNRAKLYLNRIDQFFGLAEEN